MLTCLKKSPAAALATAEQYSFKPSSPVLHHDYNAVLRYWSSMIYTIKHIAKANWRCP